MKRSETRKRTRLREYDYSSPGAYFVTMCTEAKRPILCRIVGAGVLDGPGPELTDQGKIVQNRLEEMGRVYDDISIDHYVIMPNHVHLLLTIRGADPASGPSGTMGRTTGCAETGPGPSGTPAPTNARLPQFISTLKRYTNREIGSAIWQRSYHDHIIRDERDYLQHWQYIDDNPAKWLEDPYFCDTINTHKGASTP